MSDWEDAGLPCPRIDGYAAQRDAGLVRTPFETQVPRQIVRWDGPLWTFDISFSLTGNQTRLARDFLAAHGYKWFTLPLIGDGPLREWGVRLIEPWSLQADGADRYTLSLRVESPIPMSPPPALLTSRLYPLRPTEALRGDFQIPLGRMLQPILDYLAGEFRPPSGQLGATYFPHIEPVNEVEYFAGEWRPLTGQLGTTYYPHAEAVTDDLAGTWQPLSGSLQAELDIDADDDAFSGVFSTISGSLT